MDLVVLILLGVLVVAVAIDAARRDYQRRDLPPRDEATVTTQKIIVDLSQRR